MTKAKFLAPLLLALLLGACGGGGSGDDCEGGTIAGSCGGTTGGGDIDGDGADTALGVVAIGSGSTSAFANGVIDDSGLANQGGVLSAGGSVALSVLLVVDDGSGNLTPYTEPANVSFTSSCLSSGLATMEPASTVASVEGTAEVTYVAQGCNTDSSGTETVTARVNIAGTDLSATTSFEVEGADVGSIEFVSADPETIGLKGTGGQGIAEQSTVRFRVVDETKGPVAGRTVNFSLNTEVGGITLQPITATSDSNGVVQTVIQSGTVATSVRITATEVDTGISTQSSRLTISTGIPHQDAFSISLGTCNTDSFNRDGIVVPVTVFLSDRFQNPVPDGTSVSFTAEGGQIENGCATNSGSCTVNWTSSNPRPAALSGDISGQTGGRVRIVATAIGEESFVDEDGDFVYDAGESFGDLPEAFRDDNENGVFDIGIDGFFLDFNNSGTFDAPDGRFNGLLCSGNCSSSNTLGISADINLVMGTSELSAEVSPAAPSVSQGGSTGFTVLVEDLNGNYPAAGTVIVVTDTVGGTIVGPDSYDVADSCGAPPVPFGASFTFKADDEAASGTVFISGITPSGIETLWRIDID